MDWKTDGRDFSEIINGLLGDHEAAPAAAPLTVMLIMSRLLKTSCQHRPDRRAVQNQKGFVDDELRAAEDDSADGTMLVRSRRKSGEESLWSLVRKLRGKRFAIAYFALI